MSDNNISWAKVESVTTLVENIEVASAEWVADNTPPGYEYIEAYQEGMPPAYIGGVYDREAAKFIPPCPKEGWVFDRDKWEWIDPNGPTNEDTPEG